MFSAASRTRRPLRLVAAVFGASLLVRLIERAGPGKVLENIAALGWGLGLVLGLAGLSHVVKTWAWRLALVDDRHTVSFARMLALRLGSEAVGQFGAFGQLVGETLRVSLLNSALPVASRIASVMLDRALFVLSAAVVTTVGMISVLVVLPLPRKVSLYAEVVVFILLCVLIAAAAAVRKRWAVFSKTADGLGRIGFLSGWIGRKRSLISSVETKLLDFFHHSPQAFLGSFALNLACHMAAVAEVYLILRLLGVRVTVFAALAIEALTKLVNIIGVFNPGNLGTYEGGNMVVAKVLGLTTTIGLTLALTRRIRALFWAAMGGICLLTLSKSKPNAALQEGTHSNSGDAMNSKAEIQSQKKSALTGTSHVAVILAQELESPLSRVGALPALLRLILGAQKAGAARIVVVLSGTAQTVVAPNGAVVTSVRRELMATGRLPASIDWYPVGENPSLRSIVENVVGAEERVVLIAGDRTYRPSLHRRAAGWNGEGGALAFTTGSELAGIYVLSADRALDVASRCPSSCGTIEQLDAWLVGKYPVACEPVRDDEWHRILTSQDRLLAERKLDRWLVKPTDGIFARMNRRVSIPISRMAIHFPITPNMVSLFTLGVSFLAGVFFALGGYWNMVAGAALSVFASILDGCDGEVARLTLQESEFGCWLETICDYLYYLFIFAGMTIGLARSSGMRVYLAWGGLLLFGAVASFLTTGLQRHRLASGRPEQYLRIWQAQASNRRSNPFLFLGRHTEFMIRRCFLPYAFLFFAHFNITNVAFILAALGANVVWPIALYSYRTFAMVPRSTVETPPATA